MGFSARVIEGFAVAALAQGDEGGARALSGLATERADDVARALRRLAAAEPAARRAFLRSALARPALDATWAARLSQQRGARPAPELIAYLAQLSRAR